VTKHCAICPEYEERNSWCRKHGFYTESATMQCTPENIKKYSQVPDITEEELLIVLKQIFQNLEEE